MGHERSRGGNADEEFATLFRRDFARVARTTYLIVGDWQVAQELSQEAFVQLLRRWRKVSRYDNPGAWVRRVAIRDAMRARRRAARPEHLAPTTAREPETESVDVRRALWQLPPAQRAAIALHYLDDQPVAEVAALMGCSSGTVKTHLSRGREKLAGLLREEVGDEF
jgi:RNA polymerase sigma-70 factor (ECF subfamily)